MAKELVEHKVTLRNLKDLIATEQDCQQKIYAGKASDAVLDAISEKTGENFIVLIIGAFSSGKSSMINALIGEELLPHGFLPETAVLGELHYGTKKRVTLYPKKG
ncbi:MAG: dynamin family protein, partial [Selenomonadaceae bacterium]|nr:dynamin family protein [Selenomonadaceae bacterium]